MDKDELITVIGTAILLAMLIAAVLTAVLLLQ